MTTDRDLLSAYTQGSQEAFRSLADRYVPLIYAAAKRQAPPHLAEDITQAVFILLAKRAHTLRNPNLLPAWLLKVTRFCAADARRSAQRRQHHEQKAAAMAPTQTTPQTPPETADLEPHLDAALHSLSAPDRTALLLRYYNNQPLAQVALSLNTTEEAAKKRVARALEKLRKIFLRKNLTLSAALIATTFAKQAHAAPPSLAAKITTVALTKSTATTTATLIAKGATKLMAYTTAKIVAASTLALLIVTIGTIQLSRSHHPTPPTTIPIAVAPAPAAPITASIISSPSTRIVPNDPTPTIEVRDLATDAPLSDATVQINASSSNGPPMIVIPPTTGHTSTRGTIRLPYPPAINTFVVISASKDGYVPVGTAWNRSFPADAAPDHFILKLEKAITIGGRVVDSQNNPLPNASILIQVTKHYNQTTNVMPFMRATTNANGEWSLNTIPETCDNIAIGASHPTCLSDSGFIDIHPNPFISEHLDAALFSQLRNRTHTLVLDPGIPVAGTVHGPDGKSVRALLTIGAWNQSLNGTPDVQCADDGRFQFGARKNSRIPITVHASGFATATTSITVADSPVRMDITLQSPRPLTAHIVDNANNPIPNATLAINYWVDTESKLYCRNIPVTFISDAAGDITWNEAPRTEVAALVAAPGCADREEFLITPGKPATISLNPFPFVHVLAINADTGKPLSDFRLIIGTADHRFNDHIEWLDYPDYNAYIRPLTDGSQQFTFFQQHDFLLARATGSHYAPSDSPPLPFDGHNYDITLPLHEADPLTGQLFDTEGSPLANTPIYLTTQFLDIYNNNRYEGSLDADAAKRDPAHHAITDKDGNFSFPPQIDPYTLVVITDKAGALLDSKKFERTSTITLTPWGTITGTILSHNVPAHAGIPIDADTTSYYTNEPGRTPHYSTTTDADGRFTLTHVFPGEYHLFVNQDFIQKALVETKLRVRPNKTVTATLSLSE